MINLPRLLFILAFDDVLGRPPLRTGRDTLGAGTPELLLGISKKLVIFINSIFSYELTWFRFLFTI